MTKEFSNQVVFITGAAHGQGRETALAFAREGAKIAALDVAKPLSYPSYTLGTNEELVSTKKGNRILGIRSHPPNSRCAKLKRSRSCRYRNDF